MAISEKEGPINIIHGIYWVRVNILTAAARTSMGKLSSPPFLAFSTPDIAGLLLGTAATVATGITATTPCDRCHYATTIVANFKRI